MAGWGSIFEEAYDGATAGAKAAANWMGETASAAGEKMASAGAAAYDKSVELAKAGYQKSAELAKAGYEKGARAAKVAAASAVLGAEKAAVVGAKGAAAVGGAAKSAVSPVVSKAAQAYNKVKEKFFPKKAALVPCMPCLAKDTAEARAERIRKRNELIAKAQKSGDPNAQKQAAQLKEDMVAVEMARLSDNTYAQYDSSKSAEDRKPPEPWKAMTDDELRQAGIKPELVRDSKAVVYKLPPDFPMDPKTVLAFRGTTAEGEDILTDHDQALGMDTKQYSAATALGQQMADAMPDAQVTGHSLGGDKAQAAGIAGGLHGMMFNSAGLHPNSVGMTPEDLEANQSHFVQYRAEGGITKGGGDPLTGLQNSPTAQKATVGAVKGLKGALGADAWARQTLGKQPLTHGAPEVVKDLSDRVQNVTSDKAGENYKLSKGKWYIPPAVGEVRGVTSKNEDGGDAGIADQHSITRMVDGFETRKYNNVSALLAATKTGGDPADYLGPTQTVMR